MSSFRTKPNGKKYPIRHRGVVAIIHPTEYVPGTKMPAFAHWSGEECDAENCPRKDSHVHMGAKALSSMSKFKKNLMREEIVRGGGLRSIMVEELAHTHQKPYSKKEEKELESKVRGLVPPGTPRKLAMRARRVFIHRISPGEVEAKAFARAVHEEEKKK